MEPKIHAGAARCPQCKKVSFVYDSEVGKFFCNECGFTTNIKRMGSD